MDRLDQIAAYVRVVELEAFQPQHAIWGRLHRLGIWTAVAVL
jgi:hypothetical protein